MWLLVVSRVEWGHKLVCFSHLLRGRKKYLVTRRGGRKNLGGSNENVPAPPPPPPQPDNDSSLTALSKIYH